MAKVQKKVSQAQDLPVEAPRRNYAPRGIAGLLGPILRPVFKRRAPAAAQLLADWPELAGPDLKSRAAPQNGSAWKLEREPYLLETSVPGIFVAGDVRFNSVKRCASAVGEGSIAVQFMHQYLATL